MVRHRYHIDVLYIASPPMGGEEQKTEMLVGKKKYLTNAESKPKSLSQLLRARIALIHLN